MSDVTQIISRFESGDQTAADELLPLVYAELRKLAAQQLRREQPGQTLQATALVHEAYLRLFGSDHVPHWNSRRHFIAAAAQVMRRILVDRARRKLSTKGGGQMNRQGIEAGCFPAVNSSAEIVAVHDALDELAGADPLASDLVKLRYFAGFSIEEAAQILELSRASAYRLWTYARAWLRASLDAERAENYSLKA